MAVKVGVEFDPVVTKKVDAALARIRSQAKGVNFGDGVKSLDKLSRPLGRITGQASEFQKSLEASNARVLAFGASVAVINKLSQAFGALVSNTVKVEATFAKINVILGGTNKELRQFGDGIFEVAKKTATSFDQVAEGALELARQGLSVEESLSRVETALKLVRVAGIDSQQAVAGLTAAIKGFQGAGITVTDIADKLAEVDTKFAVSTEDLINGLERASASARVAGVSFDELLSLITTVQERTQRGGAVIGNAFKTIFARLGRTDTLSALQDLGIAVLDAEGNVRSAVPLFQDLATELNQLGLKSEAAGEIIQKVAGVRQRDILISLVEDLNQEQSQFASALEKSAGAAGKLDEKNNSLNNTLEALINNLVVGGQQLSSVLGEVGFADAAKDILRLFSNAVTGITDLLQGDSIGSKFAKGIVSGIGGVLTGPGLALVGAIFTKLFIDLAKFGTTSLKQILGINRAAEQQKTLQQSVLQTLLQNESIQREILALEGNKVAQEQLLLKIYNQQAAALARIQKAAVTVTPGLFRGGFRGGERGVTRRGASGYVAAEAGDVSRGVGGATPGSRVVSIPNFAFGRGKRGTMVANTSEYYVPNYSGGGDAIFNKDMVRTMGLPSGAKKINAASGYIPNFAKQSVTKDPRFALITPKKTSGSTAVGKAPSGKSYSFPIFGYNDAKLKGTETQEFVRNVGDFGVSLANREAKLMTGGKPASGKIAKLGNAGSVSSLAGVIYEAAVSSILKSPEYDLAQTATFDFVGVKARNDIAKLYPGISSQARFIEAKISGNTRIYNSMAKKMEKFGAGKQQITRPALGELQAARVAGPNRTAIKKEFGRSSVGYIPNFAGGLEDAIAREEEAGIPINQIRVNQSGKLRNSKNPRGLAVTNTRDEPTGRIPNFQKEGRGGAFDDGGAALTAIFAAQAIGGLASGFIEAESALAKFVNGITNGVTILATISLLKGPLDSFSKKLIDLGSMASLTGRTQSVIGASGNVGTFAAQSRLGKGAAALGKALPGIGIGVSIAAAVAPLILELTKTKTGFEGLNEELSRVDLSSLTELGGLENLQNVIQQQIKERETVETTRAKAAEKGVTLEGGTVQEISNERATRLLSSAGLGGSMQEALIPAVSSALASGLSESQILSGVITKDGIDRRNAKATRTVDQDQLLANIDAGLQTRIEAERAKLPKPEDDVPVFTGVRREAAGQRIRDAFQTRGANFDISGAKEIRDQNLDLLKATTEVEKNSIQFEILKQKLATETNKSRNEALQTLALEAVASEELSGIEEEKLNKIISSVNENTTAVDLAETLTTELGLQDDAAQKISDSALKINSELTLQEATAAEILRIENESANATAEKADTLEGIQNSLNKQLNLSRQAAQADQFALDNASKALDIESKRGPISPERQRQLEYDKEIARLTLEQTQFTGQLSDAEAKRDALDQTANRTAKQETELGNLKKIVGELEKQKPIIEANIEAEKEIAAIRRDQSGFERGLETLDQGILNFGDQLGEAIPERFSSNLGQGLKDAVSGAKDLDDALSDAGRNFLGFVRDAFLQQAADSFTSSLMGGKEGGGSIFGNILGGASSAGQSAGQGAAGAEKTSGGIGGFFSNLFGGGKKGPQAGSSPSNPVYVSDVANAVGGGDPATQAIEELTGGAEGSGQQGFFSKMKDSFTNIFSELKTSFGDLFGGLKETFSKLFNPSGGSGGGGGFFGNILGNLFNPFGGGAGGGGFFSFLGFQNGGRVGFANGGPVGSTDTVPAMLSPGEFVVRRSAVDKYGTDFLSSLNRGLLPMQGFQNGGSVSPVASETGTGAGVGQVNNNSDFTFNIDQGGQVNQEGGEDSNRQQRDFAARVKEAVTTVVQEESRTGGTLNYLYSS
jgi:TP901 family phage tail tape measure protein